MACSEVAAFLQTARAHSGRREPNVGPGPAQIWRISGFVNSKMDGENATVWSEKWCDLKKKKGGLQGFTC